MCLRDPIFIFWKTIKINIFSDFLFNLVIFCCWKFEEYENLVVIINERAPCNIQKKPRAENGADLLLLFTMQPL